MKTTTPNLSCEEVLEAFALEQNHEREMLEQYLRQYPQYAVEIANYSFEITRIPVKPNELTAQDRASIQQAWKEYSRPASSFAQNLLESLTVPQLRELAITLGVPRQIITALREQKVIVASIPRRFLKQLANALSRPMLEIEAALQAPVGLNYQKCHKASEKPVEAPPTTFEQLLIEAQVPANKRAELMAEDK